MKIRFGGLFGPSSFESSPPMKWQAGRPMRQGWECPKCGSVMAPSMPFCVKCPKVKAR